MPARVVIGDPGRLTRQSTVMSFWILAQFARQAFSRFKGSAAVSWKYDQRIASDPNNCSKVIELLLDQLAAANWANKDSFGIHMAMEEAIMNAICHGNQRQEEKLVHVVIELSEKAFYAKITDQGSGFNLEDVPDPTEDENIEKTSGRGVKLIQHFVDEVKYNEVGNSVELKKRKLDGKTAQIGKEKL